MSSSNHDQRFLTAMRLAMGAGLSAALISMPVAQAAEEPEEDDEATELAPVQVTGSRITRLELEGATPVITISREDLDNSGFTSVADVLRNNAFNSFGSIREASGNTAQGQATISLRGLGGNRTLVLINGTRLPGSPVLDGQIQNLNTIPFAAVERIEILSDGASAIYGSDAIGGVINIVLRDDFEGGEVTARATDPDRPGGAERGVSVVAGFSGDRGRVTFALEADHQDWILNGDRPFTANQFLGGDPTDYNDYIAASFYGRNVVDYSGGTFIAYPTITGAPGTPNAAGALGGESDIDGETGVCGLYGAGFYTDIKRDSFFPGDYVCPYDFTGVAATTAQLDRLSSFLTAEYEITDNLLFTSQVLAARVESFGRYAPAAAPAFWTGPSLPAEEIEYEGNTYTLNPIDTGDVLFFRWNMIGDARDTWQYDYQFDFQAGLEGILEGVQWNVNYQYDRYDMSEWGNGYLHTGAIGAIANAGWDPRHPDQAQYADLLGEITGNSNRRAYNIMQRVDAGAQFDGPMMDGGPILFYVGGEYTDQLYHDEVLAQMTAGNIGGSAGGSSGGERTNWAVFTEASIPLMESLELAPAVRYDSYSDFGTNVSGKVSVRFQPVDYFVLRGSYGTGFRAPSLDELYQAPAFSAAFADDLVACEDVGTSLADCLDQPNSQFDTFINSNPNLEAEESTQYLVGGVFDFNQLNDIPLTLSLDYYFIEIENVITGISSQDAFWLEYTGVIDQFAPAVTVERLPNGRHSQNTVAPINFATFDTTGVDFRADYNLSLGGLGGLRFGLQYSAVLEYNQQDVLIGPLVDVTGRYGIPEWRANFNIDWTLDRHTVSFNGFFLPSMANSTTLNPGFDSANPGTTLYQVPTGSVDSYANYNIVYSFEAPWNARIQVGMTNITDEDPVLTENLTYDTDLYPLVSRATFVSYTQRF